MGSLTPYHSDHFSRIFCGDNQVIVPQMKENMFDSIVTDPPYELGVFGEKWDSTGIAYNADTWRTFYRVLKPGGYMLAFGGSRTFHRILCGIEDAGFEVRDVLMWLYGNGFPKGTNVAVALDKANGFRHEVIATSTTGIMEERWINDTPLSEEGKLWEGWNSTLKPGYEPIALVRKPLIGTLVENVREHGTGALNIGINRQQRDEPTFVYSGNRHPERSVLKMSPHAGRVYETYYPSNILCDEEAAELLKDKPRFFYTAKASPGERRKGLEFSGGRPIHTTVKPVDLMIWLVNLVTRKGGTVLDPFTGSGSTRMACNATGMKFVGVELSEEYCRLASRVPSQEVYEPRPREKMFGEA